MTCSSYRILVDLEYLVRKFAGSKYSSKRIREILKDLSKDPDSFNLFLDITCAIEQEKGI
ncbi:hypothetical protein [Acidianus sp. HS-5]|uniref:hypothetical protein n=1 Tax=Acidianus sp. HS-5 TaxID=2886040 RepID=UPI001F2D3F64|nr:hypothetical protein [Acidianus sp. HS-5]BDC17899.1 hypothetical protein HS5_07890 [Acidianus sp. HS-5]